MMSALSTSKAATKARTARARKRAAASGPSRFCPCRRADSIFADDVGTCALCGHVYTGRLPNKLLYDDPVNPALLERRLHIIADVNEKMGGRAATEGDLDRLLGNHPIDFVASPAVVAASAEWMAAERRRTSQMPVVSGRIVNGILVPLRPSPGREQEARDAAVVKSPYAPKRRRRTKAA